MDVEGISNEFREKLQQSLDEFQSIATKVLVQRVKAQGWLTTTFIKATADVLSSNNNCDFLPWDLCDSYIKFYINNQIIGETSTIWNEKYPHIDRTFTSPKISKKAPVTIEMIDYDYAPSHDMILSWNTNVRDLLNNGELHTIYGIGENRIVMQSSWREEAIKFENDEETKFYNQITSYKCNRNDINSRLFYFYPLKNQLEK